MKKALSLLLALTMVFALAVPSAFAADAEKTELIVFAAASMTETLNQIKELYEAENPDVTLVYNFDSSGTLKTQIQEGADCDVFISAAPKQMNQLEELGLIDDASRVDLLENKVALVVPEGNPAGIGSFEDLGTDKLSLIALGNADVPVGQYSEEILTYMGLWDSLNAEKKITFGTNVKDVVSQVKEGAVDCGIVYGTDAAAAGLDIVGFPPEGSHSPVIYPAAILANTELAEQAERFMTFLQDLTAKGVFEAAGFTVVE